MADGFLARVVLPDVTGIAADGIVMDFGFLQAGANVPNIFTAIQNFFNDPGPSGAPVAERFSHSRSRVANASRIDMYAVTGATELAGGPLGSPDFSTQWTLGGPAGVRDLPSECAVVLSVAADMTGAVEESGSTRPRARRRGRTFLGPLNATSDNNVTDGSECRPAVAFLDDIVSQYQAKILTFGATCLPAVWSRADATFRAVTHLWADNAFDTMRSRGPRASSRVTYP